MRLYHFTAPYRDGHLGAILRDGEITTTESNVSRTRPHAGPDVVWLTDCADPVSHHGWAAHNRVKVFGRITVDVPERDVMRWSSFCLRHRLKPSWRDTLEAVGGANTWWLGLRPIGRDEWTAVERLDANGKWISVYAADELPTIHELAEEFGSHVVRRGGDA